MKTLLPAFIGILLSCQSDAGAKVETAIGWDSGAEGIHGPVVNDAAAAAAFTLASGERSGNGAAIGALNDGRMPAGEDEPSRNFFFRDGEDGGRIQVDLGKKIRVEAVNSYSWHPGERAAQVFLLYGAGGEEPDFSVPGKDADPAACGWTEIAAVDTRGRAEGGRHAVSVNGGKGGVLGAYRFLLFDVRRTDSGNAQSNTFFSEIDVIDADGPALVPVPEPILRSYAASSGGYRYVIDSTLAPDLGIWAEKELLPVIREWYPKLVEMLPDEGFRARETVVFEFRDDMEGTPAYAGGNRISMNIGWFRRQLEGEAKGCVIHEMVHIVQGYGGGRGRSPAPGWVVEGIPDYIRWFIYEPASRGAEITAGNFARSSYDASYRTTANFLNWVVVTHDKDFIRKLNSAARAGLYSEEVWQAAIGRTAAVLGAEWKKANAERLGL